MLRLLTLLALLILAGPVVAQKAPSPAASPSPTPPATPPAAPEPQRTTATYGDWTLGCVRPEKAAPTCELVQTLFNQGNPFARTVIGRPGRSEPLFLGIAVPVNVDLIAHPRLTGTENDTGFAPIELAWRRCIQQYCLAQAPVTDEQLKKLRARTDNARIIFQDATGKDAGLPFSPRGLGLGLDALVKEEAAK